MENEAKSEYYLMETRIIGHPYSSFIFSHPNILHLFQKIKERDEKFQYKGYYSIIWKFGDLSLPINNWKAFQEDLEKENERGNNIATSETEKHYYNSPLRMLGKVPKK